MSHDEAARYTSQLVEKYGNDGDTDNDEECALCLFAQGLEVPVTKNSDADCAKYKKASADEDKYMSSTDNKLCEDNAESAKNDHDDSPSNQSGNKSFAAPDNCMFGLSVE